MTDLTGSKKPLEPDSAELWLEGSGAEIVVRTRTDRRALDIVEAIRRRYTKDGPPPKL